MRKFVFTLAFVLLSCSFGFSQKPQQDGCPTVSIEIPPHNEGGHVVFSAAVSNYSPKRRLGYKWFVSEGVILFGAGTKSISVHKESQGGSLTATVEITGLPKGCESTISETEPMICYSSPELIDEFPTTKSSIDKARLDESLSRLESNPNAKLFIIEYFPKDTSDFDIRAKVKLVTEYLVNIRKGDANSFTVVTEKSGETLTKIFLVPPGAKNPQP